MEIMDTKQIQVEAERLFNSDCYQQLDIWDEKKWIAVDDLIKAIDEVFDIDDHEDRVHNEMIKEKLGLNIS